MKLVVGIIRPERLEAVQQELAEAKVFRLTVSDVQGISPSAGQETSAAAEYAGVAAPALPDRRVKLEVAVNEEFVEPTVRAINRGAPMDKGTPGDGVVFVLPLEETIRIRTGERGPDAI